MDQKRRLRQWGKRFLVGSLLTVVACVDEVKLPIRQVEPRLVVDGVITNEAPPYPIKLTLSGAYASGGGFPDELVVNGAVVTITDNGNRTVQLEQDPLQPSYYWVRDPTFRGQPGHAYTLRVAMPNGTVFISSPEVLPVGPPIERIYAQYRRQESAKGLADAYEVFIDTQDPAEPGNYYRWSAYGYVPRWAGYTPLETPPGPGGCSTCTCWVPYFSQLTNVLSDALINGNRISRRPVFESPVYAIGKQYIEVRQYSLTRRAYQYWIHFEEQRSRTGSLFDPQPASIEGNVHQENDSTALALGYFGASAVSQRRLIIPADTIDEVKYLNRYGKQFVAPSSDCRRVYTLGQLTPPPGW